jgi:hypothetical protein
MSLQQCTCSCTVLMVLMCHMTWSTQCLIQSGAILPGVIAWAMLFLLLRGHAEVNLKQC